MALPRILYFIVFAICLFAMTATFVAHKKDGFKDGICLMTVSLAGLCGILVSMVYLVEDRTLSGLYAVHMSFVMSPLFLQRVFEVWWLRIVGPIAVSSAVVAGFVFSVSGIMFWNMDRWLPVMMTAALIVQIGINIFRLTDGRARFDVVTVCREWMMSIADVLYYAALVLLASIGLGIGGGASWNVAFGTLLCVTLLVGLLVAMWLRLRYGRIFLFLHSREETYLGNIRNSRVEYVNNAECGMTGERLFSNLKEYFEKNMPYLNPGLTITDVAKSMVTNKVYLSRAINEFTGQNFCQFVNFYRIRYAVRLFSGNSSYKVADLAVKSGFHSERTFTMAFHLYMNMSPSRWCKENRDKQGGNVPRN